MANFEMYHVLIKASCLNRNKLEKSKEDGDNFLKKAIAALNDYSQ